MINQYDFGKIVVNDKTYQNDIIILGDVIEENWWRHKGHELCIADIKDVVEKFQPTILVVGTGKYGMMKVLQEATLFLESHHVKLIAKRTDYACDIFNSYLKKENVAGAFHLTC